MVISCICHGDDVQDHLYNPSQKVQFKAKKEKKKNKVYSFYKVIS